MRRSVAPGVPWPRRIAPRTRTRLSHFSARSSLYRVPRSAPLWRFVLPAALIVGTFGALIAHRGGPPDLRITGAVHGTPTPTAQRPDRDPGPALAGAFSASGSWTLSSLPACLREREFIRGPLALLQREFPPARERLAPGTVIVAGACTITVGDRELVIRRGSDRLRVPPRAALYRTATRLTLVYIAGARAEIRRY